MKITFGRFFRNTPATIMRCGLTFRLARTHPARARSSGSEILSRSRSLVGYTIDTHESEVFGSHKCGFPCFHADHKAAMDKLAEEVLADMSQAFPVSDP